MYRFIGKLIFPSLLLMGFAGVSDAAQRPLAFEVASVKPNRSSDPAYFVFPLGPGDAYVRNGGLFSATNQPLVAYVRFAFKLGQVDVPGLPSWAYTEAFDIEARAQGNPTKDEMRQMMLSLLSDRFRFTSHTETQTKPAFEFLLAKPGRTGPQLRVHSDKNGSCQAQISGLQLPDFPCGSIGPLPASAPERGRIGGRAVSIERLAAYITNPFTGVDRPVFDRTGLTGTFDFSVEWALPRDSALPGTDT
jgi:uncharacterized protein (TIGR03435 family)